MGGGKIGETYLSRVYVVDLKGEIKWDAFIRVCYHYCSAVKQRGRQMSEAAVKRLVKKHRIERFVNVLNLGAGVQSTTVYLMMNEGLIPKADVAVFGDTQAEPVAVYKHLAWLRTINDPPIVIRSRGSLTQNLIDGCNSTGQSFISIPAFTAPNQRVRQENFKIGMIRRQCTSEYKLQPVERYVRRELLKCAPGKRIPTKTYIRQWFGISADEVGRSTRIEARMKHPWRASFPLIDMGMTRADCVKWLEGRVPHKTPRSACVYCPYKSDAEWLALQESPEDWAEAVRVDEAIRDHDKKAVCTQGLNEELFLHRSCIPLVQVQFNPKVNDKLPAYASECIGMCGN